MNSFNVKTPDEWKENLYTKTNHKKIIRIRPASIFAAVVAVIICISGSAFAVRFSKAPEYFGSTFLGNSEIANEVYSEKNYYFDSTRDDLTLKCKGIAGDNFTVNILFELKSTGEILFDENKMYHFTNLGENTPFMSSVARGMSCNVIDERTMEIDIDISGINVSRIVGKIIDMYFKNIETFDKTEFIECEFSGELVIDYHNTVIKLNPTDNTINVAGVEFKPLKGELSNYNFDYSLEVVGGEEDFAVSDELNMLADLLTLNYSDGTSEDFRIKMPPENEDDVFPVEIGKRKNNELHIRLYLRKPVYAANVTSVELNGTEIFVK